jgi:8-oxo-dGTP diphosphatase
VTQKSFSYRYPHPAVTVDLTIFTVQNERLELLLVKRGGEPFKGQWALPGGFVRINEDLSAAAARELQEETGISNTYLQQVAAFGKPDRDPRERVISVAFFAVISADQIALKAGSDAADARWWPIAKLPELAFDHDEIIAAAYRAAVEELPRSSMAFQFLKLEFTLTDLQQIHEAVQGKKLDKRNFRKWVLSLKILKATGRYSRNGRHRPAELFRLRARGVPSSASKASLLPR